MHRSEMQAHTLILGLGNPLMADDGAGVRVAGLLCQQGVPRGVVVRQGGNTGWGLVPEMDGYQRVILVDCAKMEARPGEWRRFTLGEAELLGRQEGPLGLHHAGVYDALRLAGALGVLPREIIIYGIEPARVGWDGPMSSAVEDALPAVARAVLSEVTGGPSVGQPAAASSGSVPGKLTRQGRC